MKITATLSSGFSPQLMRAVSILRMGGASLAQFLSQHNNPCLQYSNLPPPPATDDCEEDDIRQKLHSDCAQTPLSGGIRPLITWLIECVNDDGFLELPDILPAPPDELDAAIHRLQQIAPTGVAARHAGERQLLLLLQTTPNETRSRAETLLRHHWQWLARKRWDKLPQQGLTPALALIESLPPAQLPAAAAHPAVPDIMFARQRGLWRAQPAAGAEIRVAAARQDGATLSEWRGAREIVSAVNARRRWLLIAAQYAADHQSAFFQQDASALRPLPMKTAAAELDISPAMLSHIVSGKRAIFSNGEFPLKYLYGSNTASTVIQYKIRQMIASENPRRPLSDNQLCQLLAQQGLHLARRTVAKHRQNAGAAGAAMRKRALS